jgi:hypothetical protein
MARGPAVRGLKEKRIKPEWADGATDHIRRFLMSDDAVFEWGAGRSTIWLAERVKRVHTIESDPDRYSAVAVELGLRGLTNATVYFVPETLDYAHTILCWKRKFHLIAINERGDYSRLECAIVAIRKAFRGSLIILSDSDNLAHYQEAEFLTDWSAKAGRRERYFDQDNGNEWETSVYSRP